MKSLETLIREHIRLALRGNLGEVAMYKTSGTITGHQAAIQPEDEIIYNYSQGRSFFQKMQEDMLALSRYTLTEYLPMSINKEVWTMEFDTVFGQTLIIEIVKEIKGGLTYWRLAMSILGRGEQMPSIFYNSGSIEGYSSFVKKINTKEVTRNISVENH
jgi:hypothetical protein